jgi:peptidyl-prolyl cis-trans isomerase SurA
MKRTRGILVAAVLLAAAASLAAQQPAPRPDRIGHIVAVVGDSAILNFDVQEALLAREAQQGRPLPESGPERERIVEELLQDRINELLLVQVALRDTTIRVPDEQIARAVQAEIEQRQRAVGGPVAFDQALRTAGMTLQAFQEMLTQQQRKRALIQQFLEREMRARKAPPATEAELRAAYDAARDQMDQRPATISFQQVVVRTEPSPEGLARVKARADSVFDMVRNREDFAALARRYSEDPSREQGGDLGWATPTAYVREFANVLYSLRPGEVSAPVRTRFGYHIIKVERVRGAEVQARHILFRHEITPADAERARARADSAAVELRAGGDANAIARRYGDREEPVRVGPVPVDAIAQQVGPEVQNVTIGAVVGPIPQGGEEVASEFLVFRVTEREAPRPWSLEDPQLRERLRQDVQQNKLFEEIVQELRRSTFVEIRGL